MSDTADTMQAIQTECKPVESAPSAGATPVQSPQPPTRTEELHVVPRAHDSATVALGWTWSGHAVQAPPPVKLSVPSPVEPCQVPAQKESKPSQANTNDDCEGQHLAKCALAIKRTLDFDALALDGVKEYKASKLK